MWAPDGGEQRLSPRIDEGSASTTTVESGFAGWHVRLRNSPNLRRGARTFLIFTLAGSATTVAVAWACAMWADIPSDDLGRILYRPGEQLPQEVPNWADDLPEGFPEGPGWTKIYRRGVGVRYVELRSHSPRDLAKADVEFYYVHVVYAGWPFDALRARAWTIDAVRGGFWAPPAPPKLDGALVVDSHDAAAPFYNMERLLPFDVEWLGFVVNTIFYGGILYLLVRRPEAIRRFFRIRREACAACGYPIGSSAVCTECGVELAGGQLPSRAHDIE